MCSTLQGIKKRGLEMLQVLLCSFRNRINSFTFAISFAMAKPFDILFPINAKCLNRQKEDMEIE